MGLRTDSPFHSGERVMQLRAKVRDKADRQSSGIERGLTKQTILRLAKRTVAFLTTLDSDGYPTSSALVGNAGFLGAKSKHSIEISWNKTVDRSFEPYCTAGTPIAILIPNFIGNKRLRINGVIISNDDGCTRCSIEQTYINGGKYAHTRDYKEVSSLAVDTKAQGASIDNTLNADTTTLIHRTDTIIIASRHSDPGKNHAQGLDISFREGLPGFVSVEEPNKLVWSEYAGNALFNTLGNLTVDSRCSVLAMSLTENVALRIRGKATIIQTKSESKSVIETGRGIRLYIETIERVPNYFNMATSIIGYSSLLAGTLTKARAHLNWTKVIISDLSIDGPETVSVQLKPYGSSPLLPFLAGQHVKIKFPLEVSCRGSEHEFSLLKHEEPPHRYTILVKKRHAEKDGVFEEFYRAKQNDIPIEVSEPVGNFVLPNVLKEPIVFICEDIGIVPILSILEYISTQKPTHPVWLLYDSNINDNNIIRYYLNSVKKNLNNLNLFCTTDYIDKISHDGFSSEYKIDVDTLKAILPFDGYQFYISGYDNLHSRIYPGLRGLGISDSRIHLEPFGPANIDTQFNVVTENALPVPRSVRFVRSELSVRWEPNSGSLLDLAEKHGLELPFSCRSGMCGTCKQKVLSGQVAYGRKVSAKTEKGYILLCSTLPASDVDIDI